jgi:hypothetical protein
MEVRIGLGWLLEVPIVKSTTITLTAIVKEESGTLYW